MAQIKIDLDRQIGPIDRKIYGNFVEHLGRCIYGGLYDPGSPLSGDNGFRTDVLEAVRALQVPILRYPGGNFVSGYHWRDGVGPRESRPKRLELAWNSLESNQFGTDDFIEFCRDANTEPYLCANLGNGTLDEAAAWVEYCNGSKDTEFANLRRRHGYEQPHQVKYWGLGNEVYGSWQIGHKSAGDYAKSALEFAKVMKWTDPSIKLVACGGQEVDWDWEVLKTCGGSVNYLSAHFYFGPSKEDDPHYSLCAHVSRVEEYVQILWQLIQAAQRRFGWRHPLQIALDEWNVWYRSRGCPHDGRFPLAPPLLEEIYDLTDALVVGAFLNMLQRNCRAVGLACMAQLVNVIAPIFTSKDGLFRQTIYFPLLAATTLSGEVALQVHTECDDFATKDGSRRVPYLDVSATLSPTRRKLYLSVVNFHKVQPLKFKLRLADFAVKPEVTQHQISGESPQSVNRLGNESVTLRSRRMKSVKNGSTLTAPMHSMNVYEFDLL
ncbi:MAG: alpha-N-arabinofuranosidase [Armatimonadetes bacterium]|nr:alpha-N-arabinofuranosidase [Armatimonadota bacterium]